jgi:hypothetical protein
MVSREAAQMIRTINIPQHCFTPPIAGIFVPHLRRNLPLLLVLMSVLMASDLAADSQGDVFKLTSKGCEVTVYQTQSLALENGDIEDVCFIEGSLSGGFNPTAEKAIRKNAHAACSCGTDKVYVQSRSEPDRDAVQVVMVAFRYAGEHNANSPSIDSYEAIKLNRTGAKVTPAGTTRDTTRKAYLDDYGRLPNGTAKPRSTTMIWLGDKSTED